MGCLGEWTKGADEEEEEWGMEVESREPHLPKYVPWQVRKVRVRV